MKKQELEKTIINLLIGERDLTMMYVIDFMNDRLTREQLIKKLNLTYDNTNYMLEKRLEGFRA